MSIPVRINAVIRRTPKPTPDQATIRVYVYDAMSSEGLAGAQVTVRLGTTPKEISGTTDPTGIFEVVMIGPERGEAVPYTIIVDEDGYKHYEASGTTNTVNVDIIRLLNVILTANVLDIVVEQGALNFSPDKITGTFTVRSNVAWNITADSRLTISPTSGETTGSLRTTIINVTSNVQNENIQLPITVTSTGVTPTITRETMTENNFLATEPINIAATVTWGQSSYYAPDVAVSVKVGNGGTGEGVTATNGQVTVQVTNPQREASVPIYLTISKDGYVTETFTKTFDTSTVTSINFGSVFLAEPSLTTTLPGVVMTTAVPQRTANLQATIPWSLESLDSRDTMTPTSGLKGGELNFSTTITTGNVTTIAYIKSESEQFPDYRLELPVYHQFDPRPAGSAISAFRSGVGNLRGYTLTFYCTNIPAAPRENLEMVLDPAGLTLYADADNQEVGIRGTDNVVFWNATDGWLQTQYVFPSDVDCNITSTTFRNKTSGIFISLPTPYWGWDLATVQQ